MLKEFVKESREKHWLRYLLLALILSSIGSGITFVVINGSLVDNNASPSMFVISYLLFTFPACLGSYSGRLLKNISAFNVLTIGECIGLLGLIIPLFGVIDKNTVVLMLSGTITAYIAGLVFPEVQLIFKQGLPADKLPLASGLDTLIFSSNILLGVGVGALLYNHVSVFTLLSIDGMSFLFAMVFIRKSYNKFKLINNESNEVKQTKSIKISHLTLHQKTSILLLPALAFIGTPLMGLLPSLSPKFTSEYVLAILFIRSLGQLVAPLIIPINWFKPLSSNGWLLLGTLAGFIGAYMLVPFSPYFITTVILVFSAHLICYRFL